MQNLDVISVNFWQILISLCNLVILFLILKHFLYKPVRKAVAERQKAISEQYEKAELAKAQAEQSRIEWQQKLDGAETQSQSIIENATKIADTRKKDILESAEQRAQGIIKQAQNEAALEYKKAQEGIKKEIAEVSSAVAEKMLRREINAGDQSALIDDIISEIGDIDE